MWEEVPAINQNGIITEYELRYQQSSFDFGQLSTVTVSAPSLNTRIMGLEEHVTYFIDIRAFTALGSGPYSDTVNITTLEDGETYST